MKLPDLIGMYLDMYVIKPVSQTLNISENIIIWILIGIGIIIIAYWSKLYINSFNRSPYVKETIEKLKNKQILKENLSFGQKTTLWIEDGYGVKLCNKIGAMIIITAILWEILERI